MTDISDVLDDNMNGHEQQMHEQRIYEEQMHAQRMREAQQQAQQEMHEMQEKQVPVEPATPLAGPGQGISKPSRREFFNKVDYKATVVVFVLLLLFSSGIFQYSLKPYVPGIVSMDNKLTATAGIISALIGTIIFVLFDVFLN